MYRTGRCAVRQWQRLSVPYVDRCDAGLIQRLKQYRRQQVSHDCSPSHKWYSTAVPEKASHQKSKQKSSCASGCCWLGTPISMFSIGRNSYRAFSRSGLQTSGQNTGQRLNVVIYPVSLLVEGTDRVAPLLWRPYSADNGMNAIRRNLQRRR